MVFITGKSEGVGNGAKLGMVAGGRLVEVSVAVVNGAGFVEGVENGFPRVIGVFHETVIWVGDGDFVWDAGGGSLMYE